MKKVKFIVAAMIGSTTFDHDLTGTQVIMIFIHKSAKTKCLLICTPEEKQSLSCLGRLHKQEHNKNLFIMY